MWHQEVQRECDGRQKTCPLEFDCRRDSVRLIWPLKFKLLEELPTDSGDSAPFTDAESELVGSASNNWWPMWFEWVWQGFEKLSDWKIFIIREGIVELKFQNGPGSKLFYSEISTQKWLVDEERERETVSRPCQWLGSHSWDNLATMRPWICDYEEYLSKALTSISGLQGSFQGYTLDWIRIKLFRLRCGCRSTEKDEPLAAWKSKVTFTALEQPDLEQKNVFGLCFVLKTGDASQYRLADCRNAAG